LRAADIVVRAFCVAEAVCAADGANGSARQQQAAAGREVMHRIARDEADHASFGWTFSIGPRRFSTTTTARMSNACARDAISTYEQSIAGLSFDDGPNSGMALQPRLSPPRRARARGRRAPATAHARTAQLTGSRTQSHNPF